MRNIRVIALLLLISVLAACSGKSKKTDFFKEEVAPEKPKVTTQTELKRNWGISLGKKINTGDAVLTPAMLGGYVYAASTNGNVVKVDAETGKVAWKVKPTKELISAGVQVGDGLVLFATDQGKVFALNQEDGSVNWKAKLSTEILASPIVAEDLVVARTGDGKVYGLAAYDGEVKWTISRQLPRLTLRGDSRPLFYGGAIFTGFSDGTLAAVEATNGRALWDFPISFPRGTSEIDRLADVDTDPLLVGDFIYVSSYQEVTHALNLKEQGIAWSVDISSYHPMAYDAAHLYITDKKGIIHQVSRFDGSKLWAQKGLFLSNVSAPIAVGPYVLVSDGDSNLYVMSKDNGEFVGRHKLGAKSIIGEAVVDGDNIIVINSNGDLLSFSISADS